MTTDNQTEAYEAVQETRICVGRQSPTGAWSYWSDYDFDTDAECAEDYSELKPSQLVETVVEIAQDEEVKHGDLRVVKVEWIIRTTEHLKIDDDRILEARRLKALSKLTPDEIEALGVGNLAIYSKLKFHNAPEEEL